MQINELFKKLVESELLTEETRTQLQTEFEALLNETVATAVTAAKTETEEKVRTELTEQFVADKEALIEALDTKAEEFLTANLTELHDDISRFRDLEVEYNERLIEAKKEMANVVKKDMSTLVECLDTFLEERLTVEFTELREDIEEAKKSDFGRRIFEAVQAEFKTKYVNTDETAVALAEANAKLANTQKVLESATKELNDTKRSQKLAQVLETLVGRPREVMEAILKNTPTEKLDETYNKFIGRVLHESVKTSEVDSSTKSEKESDDPSKVLAEGKDNSTEVGSDTKVVTGDTPVLENDSSANDTEVPKLSESQVERLRSLGGIL